MPQNCVLVEDEAGVRLHVWVVPGASGTELAGRHGDALKIRVAAPAEAGRANDRLLELLGDHFGCRAELVAGFRGRSKVVLLRGLTTAQAARRLPL